MTLKNYIKVYGFTSDLDHLELVNVVDINFENEGEIDEVQFDVQNVLTTSGLLELCKLWEEFCCENNYKTNTIKSVTIVS
ncbi:hypothetical protein M2146_002554 [Lachnospiraceae bacterium PF1-22]